MDKYRFNLFDFGLKKAGNISLYDENSLDDEGNIIPFDVQAAIVSHYLHSRDSQFDKPFKQKATKFIKLWTDWARGKTEEFAFDGSLASDAKALDLYLFHDVYA